MRGFRKSVHSGGIAVRWKRVLALASSGAGVPGHRRRCRCRL